MLANIVSFLTGLLTATVVAVYLGRKAIISEIDALEVGIHTRIDNLQQGLAARVKAVEEALSSKEPIGKA